MAVGSEDPTGVEEEEREEASAARGDEEIGEKKWVGWSSMVAAGQRADATPEDDEIVDWRNPEWTGLKSPPRPSSVPPEALCWVRVDLNSNMLCVTGNGGPRWSTVVYRSAFDQDSGELVHEEPIVSGMEPQHLNRLCGEVPRMETHLWYLPDPIEAGNVVALKKITQPSKSQIREHELQNHSVYRDWCKVCIEARGTGTKHKKKTPEQRAEQGASIHSDFFYMEQATFLALKSCPSGRLHALALPSKDNAPYTQKAFQRFVEEAGFKRFVNFSDNEPALLALKDSVSHRLPGCEVLPRSCPVGDHAANGVIEVAVRELKRQMRAIRMSFESKIGQVVPNDHVLLAWLPGFAAEVINVYRTDASGKTPYEREFGRKWSCPALEFGEQVYIREAEERSGKKDWKARLVKVWFVGHHSRSNSVLGLAADGLHVGAAVKRLSDRERWSSEGLEELRALPWDLKSRSSQDAGTRIVEQVERRPRLLPPPPETPDSRAFYVTKKDAQEHGYTGGCRGCEAAKAGKTPVAHNETCRKRIVGLVSAERVERHAERVKARQELKQEVEAKKQKVGDEAKAVEVSSGEALPSGVKRSEEPSSPTSQQSPKRWKADGHMRYKREAEVPAEELDPRVTGEPEVVAGDQPASRPATSDVVVQATDSNLEDVLSRGGSALSGATPVIHGGAFASSDASPKERPGDISSLEMMGLGDYEVSMSQSKWHEVSSLERVKRAIDAKRVELGDYPDWKVDVSEMFSPPRFTQHAGRLGLRPGFAVDLSTGWNLDLPQDVAKMDELIEKEKPELLTGSPDCAPFTILRNINKSYLNSAENKEKRRKGEERLKLCVERYRRQM